MAAIQSSEQVRVPPGRRDRLLPLADRRAATLRRIGSPLAGISDVRYGFDWLGPGQNHLLLGTIHGDGVLEAGGVRLVLREGDLCLSPAGVRRRYATQASGWKFLTLRFSDGERWQHLRTGEARRLPGHWLRRLVPPVEGMLAEHPLGSAVPSHTHGSQGGGEGPAEYLLSRYADRLVEDGVEKEPDAPRADPFELHATILRHQVEALLGKQTGMEPDDEAVVLASLWSRVLDRPRGPWNAEDLASALGLSRASLYRVVKRQHGSSPARVVDRLRMDVACRLLVDSQYSIEVIADQVGYASAFSFSTAFKRCLGKPPSRYRKDAIRGPATE
ncbi:MAG: helix-turn-helix transcriptional regulator [Actinomycetia bacterium]|nr:helix-turn-helix transcriptional regulator [Actinomycetes bacterium]